MIYPRCDACDHEESVWDVQTREEELAAAMKSRPCRDVAFMHHLLQTGWETEFSCHLIKFWCPRRWGFSILETKTATRISLYGWLFMTESSWKVGTCRDIAFIHQLVQRKCLWCFTQGRESFIQDTTWSWCSSGFWSRPGEGRRAGDTGFLPTSNLYLH